MAAVRVGVLGSLVVEVDGASVDVTARAQRRLLCLLAMHLTDGVSAHRDQLVDELWDGDPPRTAVSALAVYVSQLRKAGLDGVILTTPTGYALARETVSTDVEEFDGLVRRGLSDHVGVRLDSARGFLNRALDLWRGRPYDDLRFADAVQLEANRLEQLRDAAVTALESMERLTRTEPTPSLTEPPPRPPLQLVGRAPEFGALIRGLTAHRHVSIVGPGGVGKTALAAATVQKLDRAIAWAGLSETAADGLVARVASALGLPRGTPDLAHLATELGGTEVLLVLDTCEHIARPVADLVERLLADCPNVALLTTTRQVLGARDEHILILDPLEHDGHNSPAVQLLRLRSGDGSSGHPDPDDAQAELCRLLDGLPLAIEVAATHVGTLGLDGVLAMVRDGPVLPSRTGPAPDPRGLSLDATIDWSYRLLTTDDAHAFRTLAYLREPFDLDTARAVGVVPGSVSRLIGASLVTVADERPPRRLRMLDTIRAFGLRMLQTAEEQADVATRVADAALAGTISMTRHAQTIHTAAHTCIDHKDVARASALVARLALSWIRHGGPDGARPLIDRCLQLPVEPHQRLELHHTLGRLRSVHGDPHGAVTAWRAALDLSDDPLQDAELHRRIGEELSEHLRPTEALQAFAAAVAACARVESPVDQVAAERVSIDVGLARLLFAYKQFDVETQSTLVDDMTALVARSGTPEQRHIFAQRRLHGGFQRSRYRMQPEWRVLLEEGVETARSVGRPAAVAAALFHLGFFHVVSFVPSAALAALTEAQGINARIRRASVHVPVYTVTALRLQGDMDAVTQFGRAAADYAAAQGKPEYQALAEANLAWLAWHQGDPVRAVGLARMALQRWSDHVYPYPFHWTAALPLVASLLDLDRLDEVPGAARILLDPHQQLLPAPVAAAAQAAIAHPARSRSLVEAARDASLL